MIQEDVEKLIYQDEYAKLDFKRQWYWDSETDKKDLKKKKLELYKDLIALANGNEFYIKNPSYLVIGIEEKKETPHEVHHVDFDICTLQEEIILDINNYIKPSLVELQITKHTLEEKDIYILTIPPHSSPFILKKMLRPPYIVDALLLRAGEGTIIADYKTRKNFENKFENQSNLSTHRNTLTNTNIENIHNTDGTVNVIFNANGDSSKRDKKFNITDEYLKADTFQGGEVHFQNNFTYTYENSELFLTRAIESQILSKLESKIDKSIILLNGKSGYGKTTLIRQCISKLLNNESNEIYIEDGENALNLIEIVENLEENKNSNRVVIIDRFNFKDEKLLHRLLNMVIRNNLFHLILSPYRTNNDNSDEIINSKFEQSMNFAHFKEYAIFDVAEYTTDRESFIIQYNENFPKGENAKILHYLISNQHPIAFIGSIIFNDNNLEKPILELLKKSENVLDETGYHFIDLLLVFYFFTSKGERLEVRNIYRKESKLEEAVRVLANMQFITFFRDTIGGVSEFYDEFIYSVIMKEYFDNNQELVCKHIVTTVINLFQTVSSLFKYVDSYGITNKENYEFLLLDSIDTILPKTNIFDLFDFRNIIMDGTVLELSEKKEFLDKVIVQYYTMSIDGRRAYTKFKIFYDAVQKDFFKQGWEYRYEVLDFNIDKYFYQKNYNGRKLKYLKVNKLIRDYSTNYNVVAYVLSSSKYFEHFSIKEETKNRILALLIDYKKRLSELIYLENKVFTKLLGIHITYSSPFQLKRHFDFSIILKHLMKEEVFDGFSFKFLTNILIQKGSFIQASFFNIDDLIKNRLRGEFVVFELLITQHWLSDEDIVKLIAYLFKYPSRDNQFLIYKLFTLYEEDKKELFHNHAMLELLRRAINVVYKNFLYRGSNERWILAYFFNPLYLDKIIEFISDVRMYTLAQKSINIFLFDDIKKEQEETKKYDKLLELSSHDLYKMLYMEHKTYVNQKNLDEYVLYCKRQKARGISSLYIESSQEYMKYRRRSIYLFTIMAKFYLNNKGLDYPRNIIANILKVVENKSKPIYLNEIKELLLFVINDENEERNLREKSILDLANYYNDIRKYYLATETIKNAMENQVIETEIYIEYAQETLRKIKCEESEIRAIMQGHYSYKEFLTIDKSKMGLLVGKGGVHIKNISKKYDVDIQITNKSGSITIIGRDYYKVKDLIKYIKYIVSIPNKNEISLKDIAKEVDWSLQKVLDFAKDSNLPLGGLTFNSSLKEPQARGLINKIVKVKNNNLLKDEKSQDLSIKEIAKEVNLSVEELIDFAKKSNIPLPAELNEDTIIKEAQIRGLIKKINL